MFKDDFRLAWRHLYGTLKEDGHVGKAELYSMEASRFMSIIEWKSNAKVLDEEQYEVLLKALHEVLDRMDITRPLQQVESTQ